MRRVPLTITATVLGALLPLLAPRAQNGDRAGEVQTPPPAHLQSPPAPVLSPAEALKSFRLPPGFRIELVAAEPLVFDPVAMAVGPDGRLWVAEMRAYMPTVDGTGENAPIGSIAVLEDRDGDGRMDHRSEFATGLVLPRALALVANGLLVAEPPTLWFLEDTDQDGRADRRTVVASDYGDTSNPEHTANGLLWAMDNWIYSANHTTRFRLEHGQWRREPTVFRGQWGITQDDAGRLYYNNNSEPLRMDVLPAEYLLRNPQLRDPEAVNWPLARPQDVPVWPGRVTLGVNRGYKLLRPDGTLPVLTAACGPVIYRGTRFPADFAGDAFIAEPAANLIKRLRISDLAGTPVARNAYEQSEFLTSTDERFRPVNLYNSPEGGLYVVDLYRGIIQHRIYLTTYLRNQIQQRGLEAPIGRGRIWRIVAGPAGPYPRPDLGRATSTQLVRTLEHADGWWRDTAQRLLVERQDASVRPALRTLARESRFKTARLQALWTLEGLDGLDWETVRAALADADVEVATAAARLAEKFLAQPATPAKLALATRVQAGESLYLRQAALSLGAAPAGAADELLLGLASRHGSLRFLADALVSSWSGRELLALRQLASAGSEARPVVASLSAVILRGGSAPAIDDMFARLAAADTPTWMVDALLDGVERFIPGEPARRRTVFLPSEPKRLQAFAQRSGAAAQRAAALLPYLRWRGQPVDETRALASFSAEERQRFEQGREEFTLCAACHQPRGEGMAGLAPALVGSPWVNGNPGALIRILLQGKTTGESTMPPLATLEDARIAAVLTYIRRSWGHEASAVSATEVQAVRSETRLREEPWSERELALYQ